jgi:hypothetical protein
MSEYPASNDRRRERPPDYRAVFSTLREAIIHFMTGHVGPLISPYILAGRKILADLGQAIRRNMADFRNMFKRSSNQSASEQSHPSLTSDTPRRTETPRQPTPGRNNSQVGVQNFGPEHPSLVSRIERGNNLPSPSPANPYKLYEPWPPIVHHDDLGKNHRSSPTRDRDTISPFGR